MILTHEKNQGYGKTKPLARMADLTGARFCQWSAESLQVCEYAYDDRRVFSTHLYTHDVAGEVYHESWVPLPLYLAYPYKR